ncbi:MAG: hypothetical protein GWP21_01735 [Euryarchaeota archaeon]|nr:hypothetical protein [Euryarchaeota archaeon]
MGIRDWFKKKPGKPVVVTEQPIQLPELDKDALFAETLSALDSAEVELAPELVVETTPEYDAGEVDVSALLDDELESNYDLNTAEDTEIEDMLVDAKIIGDLPEEVEI